MNPTIDTIIHKASRFKDLILELRKIILTLGLTEEIKWGKPCYSFESRNIVLIQPFKEYVALLFFKGAILNDPKNLLIKFGENTQSARQLRFTKVEDLIQMDTIIRTFTKEAMEIEKSGKKVVLQKSSDLIYPIEFQKSLEENVLLKKAFEELSPGRQRAYYLHFTQAKQSQTREARIQKCIPKILLGKGINE